LRLGALLLFQVGVRRHTAAGSSPRRQADFLPQPSTQRPRFRLEK
jgi:hypothetical protein